MEVLSTRLRSMRRARGWSQEELAERAGGGIDQSQISQWEGGRKRPTTENVAKLARAFEMAHEDLLRELGYIDDPAPRDQGPPDLPPALVEAMRQMIRDHPELAAQFARRAQDEDFPAQVRELGLALGYVVRGWAGEG